MIIANDTMSKLPNGMASDLLKLILCCENEQLDIDCTVCTDILEADKNNRLSFAYSVILYKVP